MKAKKFGLDAKIKFKFRLISTYNSIEGGGPLFISITTIATQYISV
jgi:hypothetical protein